MPTYPYTCPKCGKPHDICKNISAIDALEQCSCGAEMDSNCRRIVGGSGFLYIGVEEAQYNHGLGCVTKSRKHRNEIAKRMGVEEVGNDIDPNKEWNVLEKDRETKQKREWNEILGGIDA